MGGKRHSEELKNALVTYWQKNHLDPDWRWAIVAETFSLPINTAKNIVKKYQRRGSVENDTSKHRRKSTTPRLDRLIVLTCKRNPHKTLRYLILKNSVIC